MYRLSVHFQVYASFTRCCFYLCFYVLTTGELFHVFFLVRNRITLENIKNNRTEFFVLYKVL